MKLSEMSLSDLNLLCDYLASEKKYYIKHGDNRLELAIQERHKRLTEVDYEVENLKEENAASQIS